VDRLYPFVASVCQDSRTCPVYSCKIGPGLRTRGSGVQISPGTPSISLTSLGLRNHAAIVDSSFCIPHIPIKRGSEGRSKPRPTFSVSVFET
jgi:hypothetical protein